VNLSLALNLLLSLMPPLESAMNEELGLKMIQEWKDGPTDSYDFGKQQKLGALAREDAKVMKLLLKELETRDAPNKFYVGDLALLLGRSHAEEAIPALFGILQDRTRDELTRSGAGRALGLIGKPALPTLAQALKSSDVIVRMGATDALSAMGDLDLEPKKGAVKKGEPRAIPLLLDAMQDDEERVRHSAVGCFCSSFTAEFAVPYLRKALQHENGLVRAGAAGALIEYKVNHAEAEKTLLELLAHANVEVRAQAVRGLGHENRLYTKAAVAPLRSALEDRDRRVRAGAALALSRQGPAGEPAVGDLLKAFKEDKDESVRVEAATALGAIGPAARDAVPALIGALKGENSLVPLSAINALGDIGPDARAAIPILESFLQGTDDDFEIALALAKIRGQKLPRYKKS
jgi:HEAT repeat protein